MPPTENPRAEVATVPLVPPAAAPLTVIVDYQPTNGGWLTILASKWTDTDKPTCGGLCPASSCKFADGMCLRKVQGYIPPDACESYGLPRRV